MELSEIKVQDRPSIWYRAGTSDETILSVFMGGDLTGNSEYIFPNIYPKVIFDIGANIGVASIWLAARYPDAIIHAFEPVRQNFEILEKNVAEYENIKAHPVGLDNHTHTSIIHPSLDADNWGGFSLYEEGSDTSRAIPIELESADDMFIKYGPVDLVKIDAEGSEFSVLTTLSPKVLESIKWITGELHGARDFDLLSRLSNEGFDIAVSKSLNHRTCPFLASRIKKEFSKT